MTPDQEEKLATCMDELAALKAAFVSMVSGERKLFEAWLRELEAEVESKDKAIQHLHTALEDAYYDISQVQQTLEHRRDRCAALVDRKPKAVPAEEES